jgi:hypothetical protein
MSVIIMAIPYRCRVGNRPARYYRKVRDSKSKSESKLEQAKSTQVCQYHRFGPEKEIGIPKGPSEEEEGEPYKDSLISAHYDCYTLYGVYTQPGSVSGMEQNS